ncbi:MAG: hypothetical protein U5K84_08490 [Alkalibacterium sp.]|nr:hypothetical protein [Alkalibacterium sp.]
MKFLYAQQQIGNMVAEIERLVQNQTYTKDQLILVCTEDHRADSESMVEITVQTVDPKKSDNIKDHPFADLEIEDDGMNVYEHMVSRGGYILLASDIPAPDVTEERNADEKSELKEDKSDDTKDIKDRPDKSDMSSPEDVTPPGFGVDFNEPKSDADTHEDVLNPKGPNPDNHRR